MKRALVILCTLLLLSGCSAQSATREKIMVTALGIHEANGGYRLSVQAVDALKTASGLSEQDETATTVYVADGESLASALDAFLNEAGRRTYILQNRVIVISEACLRTRSLYDVLAYIMQNREGRTSVAVAVCRGDPADVLSISSGNDAIPADYVVGLLKEGDARGTCRYVTLLETERTASGMYDAAIPILVMRDGAPALDGTALFRDGQYCGELNARETKGFAVQAGDADRVLYTVDGVTYTVHNLRTRMTVERNGDGFAYGFSVSGHVSVTEQPSGTTVNRAKLMSVIRGDVQAALNRLDATDCDALGMSRQTAQRYPSVKQTTVRSHLKGYDKTVAVTLR